MGIGWIWTACRVQLLPNGGSVAALNRIGSNEVNTDNSPIRRKRRGGGFLSGNNRIDDQKQTRRPCSATLRLEATSVPFGLREMGSISRFPANTIRGVEKLGGWRKRLEEEEDGIQWRGSWLPLMPFGYGERTNC
ncbi:uncharacterized protein LOC100577827 [Apis mellifera]|uniref:Uncharacterized protein LOC100577827 n=1 Tax=Apis mellifera TaxID=7460 RepID=A0A7M7KXL2_APIME|nr:uncharacterized protein LOC100577827 [Apis mellifera]|eukprot:XP_026294631.1 uncharacterized protein LOC100577827 [Apis mellifera]